jgi:hypothetical protein
MKRSLPLLATALVLAGAATPALANITVISAPPFPQNPPENVLLTAGSTGATLLGVTNQTNTQVRFTSSTDILLSPPQGQAYLASTDGSLQNLNIALNSGFGFTAFEFNVNSAVTGPVTLIFTDQFGHTQSTTTSFDVGANGSNFFNAFSTNGEVITRVSLTGANIASVGQVRLGGVSAIPEPASWALLIVGFGGAGALLRKRRRLVFAG